MAFSHLSSAQVRQLIKLIQKKEAIQARLKKIDLAIESIESGSPAKTGRRGRPPGSTSAKAGKTRRSKRLKEPLLKLLKAAGSSGVAVKDLAAKLNVKPGNIFSWFYTTGRKIKGITKVGAARYALKD